MLIFAASQRDISVDDPRRTTSQPEGRARVPTSGGLVVDRIPKNGGLRLACFSPGPEGKRAGP